MKQENTICYKVSESIKVIETTVKTGNFNAGKLAKLLHQIRKDAQKMEDGLKARKNVMIKNNLEKEYQKNKKGVEFDGINEISKIEEISKEKEEFEVTIKRIKTNKIVYKNKSHAGVICNVEKLKEMDKFGEIDGTTQVFTFGHTLAFWFAFDQLRQAVEGRKTEIMSAIQKAVNSNELIDPEVRANIIKLANQGGAK